MLIKNLHAKSNDSLPPTHEVPDEVNKPNLQPSSEPKFIPTSKIKQGSNVSSTGIFKQNGSKSTPTSYDSDDESNNQSGSCFEMKERK